MAAKGIVSRPWCPFCGQEVGRPREPEKRKLGEFLLGKCQCGAFFASDPTGHNVGSAMIEALVSSCNDDWDLAWSLLPEDDYLTALVERYDEQTHQIVETGNLDGRTVRGVLYFVRPHRDIAEHTSAARAKGDARQHFTPPSLEPERAPEAPKKRASRDLVKDLTDKANIDGLVALALDDPKTMHFLQRLLYTPDEKKRWSAVHIIGKVCARVSTRKPGRVSDLLHRLFAACSDSASTNWGAIETIGAVIGNRPDIFGPFTRHLIPHLGDPSTECQVLWALGTIALHRPELIRALPFYSLFQYLSHDQPLRKGLMLRLLRRIGAHEARKKIEEMTRDDSDLVYYEDGEEVRTTVARLAKETIATINNEGNRP